MAGLGHGELWRLERLELSSPDSSGGQQRPAAASRSSQLGSVKVHVFHVWSGPVWCVLRSTCRDFGRVLAPPGGHRPAARPARPPTISFFTTPPSPTFWVGSDGLMVVWVCSKVCSQDSPFTQFDLALPMGAPLLGRACPAVQSVRPESPYTVPRTVLHCTMNGH